MQKQRLLPFLGCSIFANLIFSFSSPDDSSIYLAIEIITASVVTFSFIVGCIAVPIQYIRRLQEYRRLQKLLENFPEKEPDART